MTSEEIVETVTQTLGDKVERGEVALGDAVLFIAPEHLPEVAAHLKNDPALAFDYLSHISGVDYLDEDREPRFEAVYEFHSMDHNHSVRLRVGLAEENPTVPSLTGLWGAAVYPERELYDMFGFTITGLDNDKRLIMPEGWEGFPLRKDYPLTTEDIAFSHNRDYKSELVKSKPPTR
ncbi:MAG: NADH-quinone oxidoreductase subunit C [Nitrospinaceae bacterium]|jgi:NADH-quinone oxidoreductase subunit C|nr:MAG: NADH-quinone oxidoreductase subunit C [Nitrospinaceae bacterium]